MWARCIDGIRRSCFAFDESLTERIPRLINVQVVQLDRKQPPLSLTGQRRCGVFSKGDTVIKILAGSETRENDDLEALTIRERLLECCVGE
jgi:hypothetical protein